MTSTLHLSISFCHMGKKALINTAVLILIREEIKLTTHFIYRPAVIDDLSYADDEATINRWFRTMKSKCFILQRRATPCGSSDYFIFFISLCKVHHTREEQCMCN